MKFKLLLDELTKLDFELNEDEELNEPSIFYTIWQQY
jgi:hypothetical protein